MLRVLRPCKNKLTQGYSDKHKGYDHSGKGDTNYHSSFHGVVVQAKNSETKNWLNKGKLTTADYGNYIKIKANVDGKTVYQLGAHFAPGTVLSKGATVKRGQVVATIGNTGNSTANHSHTEFRDEQDKNFPVEFVDQVEEDQDTMEKLPKDNVIRDFYRAAKGEFSEDEIKRWLQENKNLVEIFTSVLDGDDAVKERLLDLWKIDQSQTNFQETAEGYKRTYDHLKEILKLPPGADSEEVAGKVKGLLEDNSELVKLQTPKTVYKYNGEDYEALSFWGMIIGFVRRG